jgi:hypothetical protein
MSDPNIIKLFVGDPIADPSERSLIARLQRDLERLGVPATLYANFFPAARKPRQVDLFVWTAIRTAHVEVKGLSAQYPVRGRPNGPWVQLLPDGTERSLATNCGRQALDGTYAIGDAMRSLARSGAVSAPEDAFKHHIDSIVGMWQNIPDGSDIEAPQYVTVLGYTELLERLITPGPVVAWTDEEWEAFARFLNLFQPEAESPAERRRRNSLDIITDYQLRARSSFADGLGALIDLGATDPRGAVVTTDEIDRRVLDDGAVAVVGPSGYGKSFHAQHLAVRHCDRGRLVVWIRAGEYEQGRFKDLLARAMAPFSARRWSALTDPASVVGVGVTIILDGLNECPENLRAELLQQLKAFTLRHPAGVLVTSTTVDGLNDTLGSTVLRAVEPDENRRRAILEVHGAKCPDRVSDQFRTPYELAVAAACESELDANASVTELHDAYIRRFAPTEQLRAGLRAIATRLHTKLRTSLPLLEANSILNSTTSTLTSSQVDSVLGCPLLAIEHHRVRFRHELIGQFLAAEHVVGSALSGCDLGRLLGLPANLVRAETALHIDVDARRVWDALKELAETKLMSASLFEAYGREVAHIGIEDIRDLLRSAIAATVMDKVTFDGTDMWRGRWITERQWTTTERAMLASSGHGLTRGLFIDEVCELLDRTDELCLRQARTLKRDGVRLPVSVVVAATLNQAAPSDGRGLAASYVATAFELTSMTRFGSDRRSNGLSSAFNAGARDNSWCRLYLAVLSIESRDPVDQALFASLLRRAWDAGGYHLQLEALHTAEYFGDSVEPHRTDILATVKSFESDHWALQSTLVEVLARFGEIDSGLAPDELLAHIIDVISHPDDIDNCRAASTIVSNQFEPEEIVGPYCAAIESLRPREKAQLLTMAARGSDPAISLFLASTLDDIRDLLPTGDGDLDAAAKEVFRMFLDGPATDAVMPTEAVNTTLAAIRGWAKFESALPPESADLTSDRRNWRLIASLLLRYERDDAVADPDKIWSTLLVDPGQTILTLSCLEGAANRTPWDARRPVLERLIDDYPARLRELFEWALEHPADVPTHPIRRAVGADHFVIRMLGAVGDEGTAERLRVYTLDPDVGRAAVDAIRQIHQRAAQCSEKPEP